MRWQVVTQVAARGSAGLRRLFAQFADLPQQQIDLLLLADDDLVQFVEQVFLKAGLDFQFSQALFSGAWVHTTIGTQKAPHLRTRMVRMSRGFAVPFVSSVPLLSRWWFCLAWLVLAAMPVRAAELEAYTEDWAPYNYLDGSEVRGIATDMLRAMCREAKIRCNVHLVPWARAYKTAQENPNTVLFTTARKASRESEFLWVGPILPRSTWIYVRAGLDKKVQTVKDLSQYRVGVVRGEAAVQDLLDAGLSDSALAMQSSNADVMRMLSGAMVDAMVETEVGMAWTLRNASLDSKSLTRLMKLSDGGAYYFALNLHTDAELVTRLQSALDKLRHEGRIDAILRAYAVRHK